MTTRRKIILLSLAVLLVIAQFIPIDRSVPIISPSEDFLTAVNAPAPMATLLKDACYDCHSYETKYPSYANVAPLSFWIQGHIKGGRQKVNFSEWSKYPADKAAHKLEECIEEIQERHMPMKSYTWLHAEAKMTDEQVDALAQWLRQVHESKYSSR